MSTLASLLYLGLQAANATPVAQHGLLKIADGHLCSAAGQPVQLRGMSLFWSQWAGQWYTPETVDQLVDGWGCTLVRAAVGVEMGGFLTHPAAERAKLKAVVDAAIAKGVYVLIDWHDHHAERHLDQAKDFFAEVATTYRDVPNVLYEIYNEPMGVTWPTIKRYAESVVGAIRGAGARNVVVIGTPNWSQDVEKAAADPLRGDNLAYALHFYAGTHKQGLRDKALKALKLGLPLVVTEFGTCDASGNGGFNPAETDKWLSFVDEHKLSWCNWSLFDKNETASALKPGTSPRGPWSAEHLTPSGQYVVQRLSDRGRAMVAP